MLYYVQVTDRYDTTGPIIEYHEGLELANATRILEDCEMAYPENAYLVESNLPRD